MAHEDRAPHRVRIVPDEYHIEWVGRTCQGYQFFVTHPFEPSCDFSAVYLWNADGTFREALIQRLGPREELPPFVMEEDVEALLAHFIPIEIEPIQVAPFSVHRFDTEFGLIVSPPEDEEDDWSVSVEPGNYLVFYPPWDGEYDT